MVVLLIGDARMQAHRCEFDQHIEIPERLARIFARLQDTGLEEQCTALPTVAATKQDVELVHTKEYVEDVLSTANMTPDEHEEFSSRYEDVYVNGATANCAMLAVGSSLSLAQHVLRNGPGSAGLALIRPPGHHAFPAAACGFCLFNNVAIAAKKARKDYGVKRVLIVDWDVHAGQGTQECIQDDPDIRLVTIHRYENGRFWPNLAQCGVPSPPPFVNTTNVPLNAVGSGDTDYLAIMRLVVLPLIHDFQPELILVSSGFDAAIGDPEGEMRVTPAGFAHFARILKRTNIPLVLLLEGGYLLESVESSAEWVVRALLDQALPALQIERHSLLSPALSASVFAVIREHSTRFPTFGVLFQLLEQVAKTRHSRFDAHALDAVGEFRGERTRASPYPTRDQYTPVLAKIKDEHRQELAAILAQYPTWIQPIKEVVFANGNADPNLDRTSPDGKTVQLNADPKYWHLLKYFLPVDVAPPSSHSNDGGESSQPLDQSAIQYLATNSSAAADFPFLQSLVDGAVVYLETN